MNGWGVAIGPLGRLTAEPRIVTDRIAMGRRLLNHFWLTIFLLRGCDIVMV